MERTRLLIIDDNKSLVEMIKEYFSDNADINVTLTAYDGAEGMLLADKKKDEYDIILLDLIMPVKDGIAVLEHIKKKEIDKEVIVLTSYNTQDMIRKVSEMGVSYFILKPFELADLEKRIIELREGTKFAGKSIDLYHNNLQKSITNTLHELGVPSHIKGYQFIRTAILMVYENPGFIGGITKDLYPDLSMKFNTSIQRVERAIRHAIEVSWLRGDIELMEEIFGHSVDIDRAKPTNSEFIVTIADKLRLEMINVR